MTGSAAFAVDHTGLLVMATGRPVAEGLDLRWYDRAGQALAPVGLANYRGLELSPDGKHLASHRHDASAPIWSPDGTSIAFTARRNGRWGVYQKPANGAGADELLFESETPKIPMAWSPDGATLVFVDYHLKSQADLWLLPVTGDRTV